MPATPTATVSYKKKDGTLTLSDDRKYLFFTPPNASPAATVPVADITNLQQTPESSAKVALKVFVKDDSYVFSFTSKENARKEQEAVTEMLRHIIQANKADSAKELVPPSSTSTPTPAAQQNDGGQGNTGQSAAMAIAKAISSKAADEGWYDDSKLKSDFQLQRSLLEANKPLQARFNEALRERPESVSVSQFTSQFWSTRLHLLRAHAIDKAQQQGEYNVLPEIRFTRKQGEKEGDPDVKMLNITKEQIKLIFKQYPVVKQAYDENVPPLDAGQFWTRFFGSRLLKKLKGEKIMQQDALDSILDKYLDRRESGGGAPATIGHNIPHFIDLEGNEQNHSQRLGNRPDEDMRPSSFDKVPILRTLNNLSEKMLSHVAPEDGGGDGAHQPIGMDEETFEQLRLRDLAMDDEDHRVRLNVRQQQQRYLGDEGDDDLSAEAKIYMRQDPDEVLAGLRSDLLPERLGSDGHGGTMRLDQAIGFHSDEHSDSEDEAPAHQTNGTTTSKVSKRRTAAIGSHAAMTSASSNILKSITRRRAAASSDPASLHGLSQHTFDQLAITHNTTTEFLHYFWTLFLSGDSSRSAELAQLVATLERSLDRINAVGATAEAEREKKVEARKSAARDVEKRTGKRRKLDLEAVGGGKGVVDAMVRPTVEALGVAGQVYRKALEEQTREVGAAGG